MTETSAQGRDDLPEGENGGESLKQTRERARTGNIWMKKEKDNGKNKEPRRGVRQEADVRQTPEKKKGGGDTRRTGIRALTLTGLGKKLERGKSRKLER